MFEITTPSILTMMLTVILLSILSYLDLKYRRASNRVILAGVLIAGFTVVLSGHLLLYTALHLLALLVVTPLAYVLWRVGSIGGADAKSLILVALLSPGLEFTQWDTVFIEVASGDCLRIVLMLVFGLLYQRVRARSNSGANAERPTPLIPLFLLSYLLSQLLALL